VFMQIKQYLAKSIFVYIQIKYFYFEIICKIHLQLP
jgi:hypothetical protein